MVHHALYQKQNYSYAGIIEALSGAPFRGSDSFRLTIFWPIRACLKEIWM